MAFTNEDFVQSVIAGFSIAQEKYGHLDKNWTRAELIHAADAYIRNDGSVWPWGQIHPYDGAGLSYPDRLQRAMVLLLSESRRVREGGEEPQWGAGTVPKFRDVSHLSRMCFLIHSSSGVMEHVINNPKTVATDDLGVTVEVLDSDGVVHRLRGERGGAIVKEYTRK